MLFPDEPLSADEIPQRQLKAELILDASEKMGVDASAVGDQDLKLGVEYLQNLATAKKFPFLCANLVRVADGKPVFPAHVVKTVAGGTRIGLFAILTPTDSDGKPVVPPPTYRIDDPTETAKREIAALRAEGAQIVIALSHLGLNADHALARDVSGIDFIVGAHSQSLVADPVHEGSTWILQAGFRAKELGRLELDFKAPLPGALAKLVDVSAVTRVRERVKTYDERIDELKSRLATETDTDRKVMLQDQIDFYTEQKGIEAKNLPVEDATASALRNQLVDLNREIVDEPQVESMVRATLEKMSKLPPSALGPEPDKDGILPGPTSGPYVGVKVCQGCHVPEYQAWAATDHARAYRSLVTDARQLDFDCVGCHTTGYRTDGGPKDPFSVGGMAAVQCEACHGPGRAHSADPKNVKANVAFDEKFCRACHSIEQTGDRFVFADYLPRVQHKKDPGAPKK